MFQSISFAVLYTIPVVKDLGIPTMNQGSGTEAPMSLACTVVRMQKDS